MNALEALREALRGPWEALGGPGRPWDGSPGSRNPAAARGPEPQKGLLKPPEKALRYSMVRGLGLFQELR